MAPVDAPTLTRDDFALMQGIRRRDERALAELYDRHAGLLFTLCLRILHDRHEAEDLLTDIFWELWDRAERYAAARGTPLAYLLTVARSRAIDRSRSGGKRMMIRLDTPDVDTAVSDGAAGTASPLQEALLEERRTRIREAMDALEPIQRRAVELSFFEDLSHSQIAERLNKPLGTVKTYIRQGIIRLRDSLRMD